MACREKQNTSRFDDGYLKVIDAAGWLGLSKSTVYVLISSGQLQTMKVGRSRRISKQELARFASAHLSGGEPQHPDKPSD